MHSQPNRIFKFKHINIQSLQSKLELVKNFLARTKTDILSISETWLDKNRTVFIDGYTIVRCDREGRRGGGACLIIHDSIDHTNITYPGPPGIDMVTIRIHNCILGKHDMCITSLYIPPNNTNITNSFFCSLIGQAEHSLILGDLNAHHQLWKSKKNNQIGNIIVDLQLENKLIMLNNHQATYEPLHDLSYKAILDFALCSEKLSAYTSGFSVTDQLRSDHLTIQFSINTKNKNFARTEIETKTASKINWDKFDRIIRETPISSMSYTTTNELESSVAKLTNQIQEIIEKSTERKTIQFDPEHHLQLPKHIVTKIKNKRKLERELKKRGDRRLTTTIKSLSAQIKKEIIKHKQDKWQEQCNDLNNYKVSDTLLWKKIDAIDKSTKPKPPRTTTILINGTPTSDPRIVAEHFANRQQDIFSEPQDPDFDQEFKQYVDDAQEHLFSRNESSDEPILTNIEEMDELIKALKNNKAPGPDKITNAVIKRLPTNYRSALVDIANASMKLAHVPTDWKEATIRMLLKPLKERLKDDSYRPISLLNTLSKLLEGVILNRIKSWSEKNNLLSKYQCGFRNFRQTRDQIIRMMQDALKAFNNNEYMGAIFIDIEKAFDKVWHSGLLYKLDQLKIPSYLGKWTKSYLKDRFFTVKIGDVNSTTKTITAGVPQGSRLGPYYFNINFDEVSECNNFSNLSEPPSKPACLALFADDLAAWARSQWLKLIKQTLQATLNKIERWMNKWRTKVSIAKTICTVFNKGKKNLGEKLELTYKGKSIASDQHPKFLGVTLDPSMTLTNYTNITIERAQKRINMIKSIKGKDWGASPKLIMTTYKALVRPLLEYVPFGTLMLAEKNYMKFERIQRAAVRKAYYWPPGISTTEMYKKHNIESIKERAVKLTDKYICKAYHNNIIIKEMIDEYNILSALDEGLYSRSEPRTTILGTLKRHNMNCNSLLKATTQQEQMDIYQQNYINSLTS